MKAIKFRVFIHPHCGGGIPQECYNTMDYSDNYGGDLEEFFGLYKPHFFEIMQFTGLADMNGKDIYEGDILIDNVGRKWVVIYNNKMAAFMAHFIDSDGNTNQFQHFEEFTSTQKPLEVIGNIHEHPKHIK